MAHCVATSGESFPTAMIDLVADPSDPARLRVLLWDGTTAKVAPRIKYDRHTYEPVALDPTVVCGVRWPTRRDDYGSTRKLFDRILGLVTETVGIEEQPARILVHFIFSTWLPDKLTVAPGLAIVGSSVGHAIQLLRFLQCVCRRSILLVGTSQADLISLPLSVYPTLLLDRPRLTRSLLSFLSTSNRRGLVAVRRGKVLGVCCPKVIYFGMEEVPEAVASAMLQITLPLTAAFGQALEDAELNEIAAEIQDKMLAYRLANFAKIRVSLLERTTFTNETYELAVNLAACVTDDAELAAGVVPLLKERDQRVRGQRDRQPVSVILEVVLACVHEKKKDRVQVKELAALANALLRSRGEFIEYNPEEVGHCLDMLGLHRTRSAAGMFLPLTSATHRRVHILARTYEIPSIANAVPDCPDCKAASDPALATV
jgi:hypothetical protein